MVNSIKYSINFFNFILFFWLKILKHIIYNTYNIYISILEISQRLFWQKANLIILLLSKPVYLSGIIRIYLIFLWKKGTTDIYCEKPKKKRSISISDSDLSR